MSPRRVAGRLAWLLSLPPSVAGSGIGWLITIAIKVEASGIDHATVIVPDRVAANAASSSIGGTSVTSSQRGGTKALTVETHAEFYYVPAVKNYVKSMEEQYGVDEILLSRDTSALVSYKPGA